MTNPIVDLIGDRTGRIVPIYPQSEKVALNTWEIAGLVENALERCTARGIADPVPWPVLQRLGLLGPHRRAALDPPARDDGRQGAGAPAAGVRRAAAGADRAGDAQARARARVAGHPPRHRRRAGRPLASGVAVRAHRRAAAGDRRDRGRPCRRAPDASAAAGRRRVGQDPGRGQRDADGRAGRPPGRADGADRGARRAARDQRAPAAGRRRRCPTRATCSATDRCASSC